MKRLLTIAGSDSGGGAGIQADLKTFHAFGCYGMSVLTSITAQNTCGVYGVSDLQPEFVVLQLTSVVEDIGVDAVKIGMLSNSGIIHALAQEMRKLKLPNLVLDPVMRAKGGDSLLQADARQTLIEEILPLAMVVTPNIPEAEILAGCRIESQEEMKDAARRIREHGVEFVLVKGGHRQDDATDILFDGSTFTEFYAPRLSSRNTHGTGCTFSAAIAANLALGYDVPEAVSRSKEFITEAIRQSLDLGKGIGPLNHFVKTT